MIENVARQCVLVRKDYIPGKPIEEVQQELGITDIVKMASNENPLGTSPKAIEAMVEEIRTNGFRYPVSLCTAMGEKLAGCLGVRPSQLYIDNGGDAVITMFGLTFIDPGDEIVTAALTFPAYENITTKMGGKLIKVPMTREGGYDLDAIAAAVGPRTKAVFICNPNNPTGNIVTKERIKWLIDNTPKHVTIILDEAYYDYAIFSGDYEDTRPYLDQRDTLVILRTFSKSAGLAGVRIGYAMTNEETAAALNRTKLTFGVNCFALAAGIAALDDTAHVEAAKALNRRSIGMLEEYFERRGLPYIKSFANFVFVDVGRDVREVYQKLLQFGVVTRGGHLWKLNNWLRISSSTEENTQIIIDALDQVLFGA